jgi:arylsulfatase
VVNGVPQVPMAGKSLVATFDDPNAKGRTTQYFEIAGNRAIYHDGWYARTIHKAPWEPKPRRTLADNSAWQLYDVRSDFSLANDLAAKHPKKWPTPEGVLGKPASTTCCRWTTASSSGWTARRWAAPT